MKRTTLQLTSTFALAGLALLTADANAATITWQSSVNMYQGSTVETFVSTNGTSTVGLNASGDTSGDEDVTVNGVAFTGAGNGVAVGGSGTETITINGGTDNVASFGDGEFSSNGAIFNLIKGGVFGVNSITLGGLQSGHTYEIQVFNNDARGSRHENFLTGYDDGNGSGVVGTSQLNNSPSNGDAPVFPQTDAGDSIIGTFTADSATMTINVFGTNGGPSGNFNTGNSESQINAVQLRTTAVPEPGSLALIGLGGLLIARRRRG